MAAGRRSTRLWTAAPGHVAQPWPTSVRVQGLELRTVEGIGRGPAPDVGPQFAVDGVLPQLLVLQSLLPLRLVVDAGVSDEAVVLAVVLNQPWRSWPRSGADEVEPREHPTRLVEAGHDPVRDVDAIG